MPDYKALKAEIDTDPEGIGYSGKDACQVAAALNDRIRAGDVCIKEVVQKLKASSLWPNIVADNANLSSLLLFLAEKTEALKCVDMPYSDLETLVDGMKKDGLINDSEAKELLDLRLNRKTRAQEIGFPNPTEKDIERVI